MKQITQIGATVEEAILLALHELNLTRKQVDVEIIQESKKGFLGFGSRKAEIRVTEKQVEMPIIEQEVVEKSEETPNTAINKETLQQNMANTETVLDQSSLISETEASNDEQNTVDIEVIDYSIAINHAKEYLKNIAKQLGIQDLEIEVEQKGKIINFRLSCEKAALLIGKRGQTLNALQQLTQLVVHQYVKRFIMVKLDVENYRERRQDSLEILANRMADKAVHTGRKVKLEPMPANERKIIHHVLADRVDVETYSEGEDLKRHLIIEPIR